MVNQCSYILCGCKSLCHFADLVFGSVLAVGAALAVGGAPMFYRARRCAINVHDKAPPKLAQFAPTIIRLVGPATCYSYAIYRSIWH